VGGKAVIASERAARTLSELWLAVGPGTGSGGAYGPALTIEVNKPRGRDIEGLPIIFDPESGLSALRAQGEVLRQDSVLFRHGEDIREILSIYTSINRLACFDPASYGLTPFAIPVPFSPWRSYEPSAVGFLTSSLGISSGSLDFEDSLSEEVIRLIPKELREARYAWCAGNPDTLDFGTPILTPAFCLQHFDPEGEWPEDEGWVILQAGLHDYGALSMSAWNDRVGIENLVEQVQSMSAASALSLRALLPNGEYECIPSSRIAYEQERLRPRAIREWDDRMGLRPVLVSRAIKAASEEFRRSDTARGTRSEWKTWESKVYASQLLSSPGRRIDQGRVEAARRVWSARPASLTRVQDYMSVLQRHLDARDLGTALVRESALGTKTIFIVNDIEFFEKHAPLFGAQF
jgi:hypothetical protein